MANIIINLPEGEQLFDGKQITFRAPCNCNVPEGLKIGDSIFDIVDATNASVLGSTGYFVEGSMISVILDTNNSKAYIVNNATATNAKRLNVSNVGSKDIPVYFNDKGVPVAVDMKQTANLMVNSLDVGDATLTDGSNIIIQGEGTYSNTFNRKPISMIWQYIKTKLDAISPDNLVSTTYNDITTIQNDTGRYYLTQYAKNLFSLGTVSVTVSFEAKSDTATKVDGYFRDASDTMLNDVGYSMFDITTSWKKYSVCLSIPADTYTAYTIRSNENVGTGVGSTTATVNVRRFKMLENKVATRLDNTTAVGSSTNPVYFNDKGIPVKTIYTLGKSVPSDAKFTDTTYSNMTAATASVAGKAGLVPAPAAGKQTSFLRGDGTWATPVPNTANGTTLGLVKSGGDVTISDGVITVNDDSHNHTIANVDGLQDALNTKLTRRYCMVGSDTASSSGWYKFASGSMTSYANINVTFMVTSTYLPSYSGILQFQMRSDYNSSTSATDLICRVLKWHTRIGFPLDSIICVIVDNTFTLYVNKTNDQYGRIMFEILSVSSISSGSCNITLHDSSTKETTEPTATVTSSDGATVSYANSAGSATKATGDESGNNIKASYGSALAVDGSTIKLKNKNNGELSKVTIPAATSSTNGVMSKEDKTKLSVTNIAYGTCSTAAGTAAKVVTISGNSNWVLKTGSTIYVKFTNTNTAQNPTLNVNNTGAKSIWYGSGLLTTTNLNFAGYASRVVKYVYDGTQYVFMGWSIDNNTTYTNASLGSGYGTCSTAADTLAKVVTLSSYTLATGGFVSVKFTNAVPANATMNINSKGAKPIFYRGVAIVADAIKAGDIATFIYDGTQYHLVSNDRDNNTTYGAAGTSLGLVKSGGDVTISGGVITVNDDSHNHVIGNVDGLQDALNNRALNNVLTNQDLNNVTTPGFYSAGGGNAVTNKPADVDRFGLYVIHTATGEYYTQILVVDSKSYRRFKNSSTWSSWTEDKLTDNNTTYSAMTGASASAAGKAGLVPAPAAGKQNSFLRGDGTWATVTTTDTKATQTNTTTDANYRVVLSTNANDTTETDTLRKSSKFTANPSTGRFGATEVMIGNSAVMSYNSTTESIDFSFL